DSRLRTDVVIVRHTDARDIMAIATPLEKLPSFAAEGIRQSVGAIPGTSLLDCLMASASETACPTVPTMVIEHHGVKRNNQSLDTIQFAGRAIFNKRLQLIGYINYTDALWRVWISQSLANQYITVALPKPTEGYASLNFISFKSRMTPGVTPAHRLSVRIDLGAKATVIENNTRLDLRKARDLRKLEETIDRHVTAQVLRSIRRVQHNFKADIYGVDDAFKQSFPGRWSVWKSQWPQLFSHADVHVSCRVVILTTGATGGSLGLPETPTTTLQGDQ
ncbi:MAG: Ger(x)C family spore germination C-terminal domain-containing protein, partial [Sulfobacillus sp.]